MVKSQRTLTLLDCKLEMYFTYICIAFYSNPETDYDPYYLDYKLRMQYLLSGKSQRENNYISGKLMNQRFFWHLTAKPRNEDQFWFLALEGESKLIQVTNSENLNRNPFGLTLIYLRGRGKFDPPGSYLIQLNNGWR